MRISRRHFVGASLFLSFVATGLIGLRVDAAEDASVFAAPNLAFTPVIRESVPKAGGPLRQLTVNEHVGLARKNDLVRVPLFFHTGECTDSNGLVIFDAADTARTKPIPYQADDIRHSDAGGISAMHIYFFTDLAPWQRRQLFVYRGTNPGGKMSPIPATGSSGQVQFSADDLKVAFLTEGPRKGAISGLETPFGKLNLLDGWMGPSFRLERQHAEAQPKGDETFTTLRATTVSYESPENLEIREFKYASGPIFAKVRVKVGPKGVPDAAESTYLIPRHGSMIIATERTFPEEKESPECVAAAAPMLLSGKATFGKDGETPVIRKIPTGLRKLLRYVQNQYVDAAEAEKAGFSVVNIPHISAGQPGVSYQSETPTEEKPASPQTLQFMGPTTLHRNFDSFSQTIRSFWFQNRIVFVPSTDAEKLWDVVRSNQVTLTAAVDEPGITVDDLAVLLKVEGAKFYEKADWHRSWNETAALDYLTGKDDAVRDAVRKMASPTMEPNKDTVAAWLPGWAQNQVNKLPPLDNRPSGGDKVAGPVQPYNIGYGSGAMAPLAEYWGPNERLDKICYAVGRASMLTNGAVYPDSGLPHLIAFANAYNMQIGSIYFGLYGGKKSHDDWMTMFYRDVTKSAGVAGIYGHGQRSYSGNSGQGSQSDLLYQAVCDHWLRSIELTQNEDLSIHPAVYQRFTDAIDVTGDMEHHDLPGSSGRTLSYTRGNYFRTQSHDHRWEGWIAAPYMPILENPNEESPVGITEACYYTRTLNQAKWINWADAATFFHTLVDLKLARRNYDPPTAPALPQGIHVKPSPEGGVSVTWQPASGKIAGYRVYRADEEGRIMTLLNSPYVPERYKLLTQTTFRDPSGAAGKFYFVTAVDTQGIESCWFPDEPRPLAGKEAGKKPAKN